MPLKSVTFKGMGLLRRTTRYITLMLILLSDYFRINGNLVDKYSQWVRGATEECGTRMVTRGPRKIPVGSVKTWSAPTGGRANRQVVTRANRSQAPK